MQGISSQSAMSLSISNKITEVNQKLFKSVEKLASGLKVNSAADNPAVLVISEQMRSRIASLNQQIENTSNLVNKYETASSNLIEMQRMTVEMKSLAIEAANSGLNDETMQMVYQQSADQMVASYNSAIQNAQYGSQQLIDGGDGSLAQISEMRNLDLSNAQAAEQSMAYLESESANLNSTVANLGAVQKHQLESRLSNLRIESENLQAAESSLRDTDMAGEFVKYMNNQMLLKGSIAMQAHSFIVSQSTLTLLTGDK